MRTALLGFLVIVALLTVATKYTEGNTANEFLFQVLCPVSAHTFEELCQGRSAIK
jgi:hypothetical protein